MTRSIQLLVLVMFAVYTWLCRELYLFFDQDACLDGGGVYNTSLRACIGSSFGDNFNVGARASYWFWLLLLGLPALVVAFAYSIATRLTVLLRKRASNRALQTDR